MRAAGRIACLISLLGCLGCGSERKGQPDGAPASAPASAATSAAPATAAPRPLSERLVGTWQVDMDYIKTDAEMLALPPEKREKALAMAQAVLKDLALTFGADGSVAVGAGPKVNRGTFVATPTGADTLALDTKLKTANGAEQQETITVRFVDEKILVSGLGGKPTRFKRKAQP